MSAFSQALAAPVVPGAVHVFCVATAYNLGLHNLLAGLAHHGFGYTTLEFGQRWRGWPGRMAAYRDAALAHGARHGATELVAFMDAYDALSTRDADGLVDAFRSFGKPILIGLEAGCQRVWNGNCGHIDQYWLATKGAVPTRPNRFANGGFIMGEAHAVARVYDWMLAEGHTDDQIGLADFVSKHPSIVAVDETSRVILNVYWAEGRSGRETSGDLPWFMHFAGLKETPTWMRYAQIVKERCGPFAIATNDATNARWVYRLYIALFLIALVLVAASCGAAFGAAKTRRARDE